MRSECERQNGSLKSVEGSVSLLVGEFERKISESLSPITRRLSVCETDLQWLKSHKEIAFPLQEAESLQGIICDLTRKHEGNVHDKGIVTIPSKSVYEDNPSHGVGHVADLTSNTFFTSKDEPGQWIHWDFHNLRVRPTHYTINSYSLKSWVVESSLDGEAWTEIDRKTDNEDFKGGFAVASFAVSNSAECRFIRLTQTGKRHFDGSNYLAIQAFEFFGTLLE
jgi:hypothetical protein